jgi:dephospho-CoA kinase
MIIGVTGSFGTGKTTVSKMFSKHGFKVINVDKLYHGIYDKSLKTKIKKEFGTAKRSQLKKIVFNNSKQLKKLNKITHPIIIKELKQTIKKTKNKKIIVDIPLLFESKLEKMFDKLVVVKCSKKEQIKRILKKKKYTKKEIQQIINSQMSLKNKIKKADFVVDNKIRKEAEKQVRTLIKTYDI